MLRLIISQFLKFSTVSKYHFTLGGNCFKIQKKLPNTEQWQVKYKNTKPERHNPGSETRQIALWVGNDTETQSSMQG